MLPRTLMLTRTLSIGATGGAPAALVWRRYTRPELWSSWSPQIVGVDCDDEVIRTGSTGVVHALLGVDVPFEVTSFDDPGMRWVWTARLPLAIRLHLTHVVEAMPTGSRTVLSVTGPLPVVLGYLPLARLAIGRLVRP